jgi:hypothetical protein
VQTLHALPSDFIGSIVVRSNGHGSFVLEVVYQERLKLTEEELIDFTAELHSGGSGERKPRPRR